MGIRPQTITIAPANSSRYCPIEPLKKNAGPIGTKQLGQKVQVANNLKTSHVGRERWIKRTSLEILREFKFEPLLTSRKQKVSPPA
jgi:hypothetical protein